MPVKSIAHTNYNSRPMEKLTSMNKQMSDHGNKTHYMKDPRIHPNIKVK